MTSSVPYLWVATLFTLDVFGCRKKTKTESDFNSSEKISSSGRRAGLTFLVRTEVLVWVPGSLLLFVFGKCVSGSIRVLQRPLLTHCLLPIRTLALTIGYWILWPVRHTCYVSELFQSVSVTTLHEAKRKTKECDSRRSDIWLTDPVWERQSALLLLLLCSSCYLFLQRNAQLLLKAFRAACTKA